MNKEDLMLVRVDVKGLNYEDLKVITYSLHRLIRDIGNNKDADILQVRDVAVNLYSQLENLMIDILKS